MKTIQSEESERGSLYVFAPCEDGSVDASHKSCYLEVVREGKWIGFRSMLAQNKFLQARRKGMNKLCFFNSNFGTWEQFELSPRDTDVSVSWNRLNLTFQSRRLSQFRIQVTVCRVGHFSGSRSIYDPKMRMMGSKEGQRQVLMRVSDVMVKEWAKFVDSEIKEREATEEKIELMRRDTKLLHEWTTNRLVELKEHAREDIGILQEALDKSHAYARFKKEQLKDREEELRSHRLVIFDSVMKKRELKLKSNSFIVWQKYTAQTSSEHLAVSQVFRLRSKILLSFLFESWNRHAKDNQMSKRKIASFRGKQQNKQVKLAFKEWGKLMYLRDEQNQRVDDYIKRAEMVRLNALMDAWLKIVAFRKRIDVGLRIHRNINQLHDNLRLQAAFSQWRQLSSQKRFHNHILSAFRMKVDRNRLRSTFRCLRSYLSRQKNLQKSLLMFSNKRETLLLMKVFRAWALATRLCSEIESQKLDYLMLLNLQSRPFLHWRKTVRRKVALKQELKFRCSVVSRKNALARTRRIFASWQAFCNHRKLIDRRMLLVFQKHNRGILRNAFLIWIVIVREIREAVFSFAERRLVSEMQSCFSRWSRLPQVNREKALRVDLHHSIVTNFRRRKFESVWEDWKMLARRTKQLERSCQTFKGRIERKRLWNTFSEWRESCSARSSLLATMQQHVLAKRLRHCYVEWLRVVSYNSYKRNTLERTRRRLNNLKCSHSFEQWKRVCHLSNVQKQIVEQMCDRKKSSSKRNFFYGWFDLVVERRQYSELVEKLLRRFSHKMLRRLFREWRAGTKLLVHYRKALIHFSKRSNSRMINDVMVEWVDVVRKRRTIRRSENLLQISLRRMRLVRAFVEWHAYVRMKVRENVKVNVIRRKLEYRRKRAVFHEFFAYVWNKRTMQLKVKRFQILSEQRTLRNTFSSWMSRTLNARRLDIVCNARLSRSAFISKSKAFDQWLHKVHQKNESLSNVRRCVKRKQVSLNFFLSWYWDALDDDVQFTLTNILHSAAPSSSQTFVGREYKPLFRKESPTILRSKRKQSVDVSLNPLASKNLLPKLELESITVQGTRAAESAAAREPVQEEASQDDIDTPPGLDKLSAGRAGEELKAESSALSIGLAELLDNEEAFSPVSSLVNSPINSPLASSSRLGSRYNSPLNSPYRGSSRIQKMQSFMNKFDKLEIGDEDS